MQRLIKAYFYRRRKRLQWWIDQPIKAQYDMLQGWMQTLPNTTYGSSHHITKTDTYTQFSRKLPCVFYEDLEPLITECRKGNHQALWHKPIKWFAKSSGTTNAQSKFIPLSPQSITHNHIKAGKDLLAFYYQNNPNSKIMGGKTLRLGGSHEIYTQGNSRYGDLSAALIEHLPFWAEWISLPSKEVSLMSQWEQKMPRIVAAIADRDLRVLAGVPSWMLILLRRVLDAKGQKDFLAIWQQAELYLHGGINFDPYRTIFEELFPHPNMNYVEIYNASEGFFAFQDQKNTKDLLLLLDHQVFYEFIPMQVWAQPNALQKAIPLEGVVCDQNYAMVITTAGGLYRYIIGDTVRFTSTQPYRIRITGRTKLFINAFGEEVIIENTDTAIEEACHQTGARVVNYMVGPRYIALQKTTDHTTKQTEGCHEWVIEFEKKPDDMMRFERVLDQKLQSLNSDYAAKRYRDMTMCRPQIHTASQGLFYRWLQQHGKLGGQNKIPQLHNHRQTLDQLLTLDHRGTAS